MHARLQPRSTTRTPLRATLPVAPRQLALSFDDAPLWEPSALEAELNRMAGRQVRLTVTENRSVLLSCKREAQGVVLRLHRMFLHAPATVVLALGRHLKRRCRRADGELRRFMNDNLHRVRTLPRTLPPLLPKGTTFDLTQVFTELNARYFATRLEVPITWGRGVGRARRGGLTFGSYDPVLRLIRIHPVLDRPEVPRYFLESVVYHEMLHHHLGGVPDRAGRTVYHSRAFRDAERRYARYGEALEWEKANLAYLLRASRALERQRRQARRA